MRLKHRFWQVLALSLAVLAAERRWIMAAFCIAMASWLGGIFYVFLVW